MNDSTPPGDQNDSDIDIAGNVGGRNVNVGGQQHIHYHQTPPPNEKKSMSEDKTDGSRIMRVLRDPAIQSLLAILGIAIPIVLGFLSASNTPASPTATSVIATPMTPVVEARRDLEIRSG